MKKRETLKFQWYHSCPPNFREGFLAASVSCQISDRDRDPEQERPLSFLRKEKTEEGVGDKNWEDSGRQKEEEAGDDLKEDF